MSDYSLWRQKLLLILASVYWNCTDVSQREPYKIFMAALWDLNEHPYHFAILIHFLLKLLNAATVTSLTSRTGTSPPPTHCTASELWFNSPVTPDTLLNKAPLLSSASAQEIHTGMTQSLYAKVPLCFFNSIRNCSWVKKCFHEVNQSQVTVFQCRQWCHTATFAAVQLSKFKRKEPFISTRYWKHLSRKAN